VINTLRDAGFRATTTLAEVAEKTGLSVDEVRARAGIAPNALSLGEAALDRKFAFPDAFLAGGTVTAHEGAGVVGRNAKSEGLGKGNSGAGGLLRMNLEARLAAKENPVADPPLPVTIDPALVAAVANADGAAVVRALANIASTPLAVRELVERLGVQKVVNDPATSSVDTVLFEVMNVMEAKVGRDAMPRHIAELLNAWTPAAQKELPPGAVVVDTSKVPMSAAGYAHNGQWMGELLDALEKGGVNTPELARGLAERLDVGGHVSGETAQIALYTMWQQLNAQLGDPAAIANAVVAALKEPLVPAKNEGLPAQIDPALVDDLRKATKLGAQMDALEKIVTTPRACVELLERLDARIYVTDPEGQSSLQQVLFELIQHMGAQYGNDAAGARIADALAQ
jgi:hypothetical protein